MWTLLFIVGLIYLAVLGNWLLAVGLFIAWRGSLEE